MNIAVINNSNSILLSDNCSKSRIIAILYFFAYMQNFSDIAGTMAAAKGTATIECRGKREKSDDMYAVCWI